MCAQLVSFRCFIQPDLCQDQCFSVYLPVLGCLMTEGYDVFSDAFDLKHSGCIIAMLSTATSEKAVTDVQYPKFCTEIVWNLGFPIAWWGDLLYTVDIGGRKWGKVGGMYNCFPKE